MKKKWTPVLIAMSITTLAVWYWTDNKPVSPAQAVPSVSAVSAVPVVISPFTEADIERIVLHLGPRIIENEQSRIAEIAGRVFEFKFKDMNDQLMLMSRRASADLLAGGPITLHTPAVSKGDKGAPPAVVATRTPHKSGQVAQAVPKQRVEPRARHSQPPQRNPWTFLSF